ncbi:MAG: hypothetical protein IH594_15700 [Bacteroidales bacterium]|nr:hypothetical protein [Bacteroidales bacterium]
MKFLFQFIFLFYFPGILLSQGVYRIQGEFSLKSKEDGLAQLVMGKFYYDLNSSQIIYRNFFPEKETWITSDTILYYLVNDEIISTQVIPDLSKFSIFHLALTRNLKNFGIDDKSFILENVEQDNGMVISTYVPNRKYNRYSGKIMLSMTDGMLFGIVFYDKEDKIIKKQFFEDYITDMGLPFPGKITEIIYQNGSELYKVTTYKNIIYNANEPDNLYYFNPGI